MMTALLWICVGLNIGNALQTAAQKRWVGTIVNCIVGAICLVALHLEGAL